MGLWNPNACAYLQNARIMNRLNLQAWSLGKSPWWPCTSRTSCPVSRCRNTTDSTASRPWKNGSISPVTASFVNQAIACARPGAMVGFVGVPHGVELPIGRMFSRNVGVRGGMATVRTYLPDLMERVWSGRINPGLVFDLTLGLEDAAEGYRAMDERRAIKALLRP